MNRKNSSEIEAILFDLDGVLYIGDNLIASAAEIVSQLQHIE